MPELGFGEILFIVICSLLLFSPKDFPKIVNLIKQFFNKIDKTKKELEYEIKKDLIVTEDREKDNGLLG